ncbi:Phytanoyl-CoA dioxygenase (PhyH) [Pirellulimonas nuda]|uniref:Phytanoyl-CoA dioxygenase (PhyH) n=1 Tax=Pirellulimonas nuda TaxID=2528009 RepID=A0A518DGC0_9BACT|nr:phytanoyl-CoA dioxygenase family protein [Pirellulimonas nuda]QDU90482.1 Phytanoyl-CoA dioxygenase (PhyH) [Pirellulimonas nuda]
MRVVLEHAVENHPDWLYQAPNDVTSVEGWPAEPAAAMDSYHEQGYLLVRGAFGPEAVQRARDELAAMRLADDPRCEGVYFEGAVRDRLGAVGQTGVEEPGRLPQLEPAVRAEYVRKFMGFVDRHPPLAEIANCPRMRGLVEGLVGGPAELFQEMAMIKPPRGREKPWHQDHAYFNAPLDTPIVGVWIALTEVSPESGGMYVIPGGHRRGALPHFQRRDWQVCDTLPGEWAAQGYKAAAAPMNAGDALLFSSLLPHGTPTNRSDRQRWALQFHYRSAGAPSCPEQERLDLFGGEGRNVTC